MKKTIVLMGLSVAMSVATIHAADFSSWQKKMPITFTGYNPPGGATTLTNFPALLVLSTNISGFNYSDFLSEANADLRFSDSAGAIELNHEIEKWDTNGASYAWVQVPLLAGTNTSIWAYWGKSGTTAPGYTTNGATWAEGYVGVWHLSQTNSGTAGGGAIFRDSTSNLNHGADYVSATGKFGSIDGGQQFDGANDYIRINPNPMPASTNTLSMWCRADVHSGNTGMVSIGNSTLDNSPYFILQDNGGTMRTYAQGGYNNVSAFSTGTWYHCAIVRSAANMWVYLNGELKLNVAKTTTGNRTYVYLGAGYNGYHNGALDEMRMANVMRSSNWVWACYMNQASNGVFAGSFNTYGSVQLGSPGVPQIANVGSQNVTNSSADVVGTLVTNGASAATIYLYWSTNDCATNASDWIATGSVTNLGSKADGATFTNALTGLTPNTRYYWNHSAVNSSGTVWAATGTSPSFITIGGTWNKRMPVIFAGYGPPGGATPLTNFPALVVLSTNIPGFSYGDFLSGTHDDLRFTDSSGTNELNYEIDEWDVSGNSRVWVQVPQLIDSNTYVWVHWSKSGVNAPACTTNGATWSGEYKGVWHMGQPNAQDSTLQANPGVSGGNVTATGFIGDGQSFNGSSIVTNVGTADSYAFIQSNGVFTVSCFVKLASVPADTLFALLGNTLTTAEVGFWLAWENRDSQSADKEVRLVILKGQSGTTLITAASDTNAIADTNWHHVVAAGTGTNVVFWVDGVSRGGSGTMGTKVNAVFTRPLTLGGSALTTTYALNGKLDEVRIENVTRSSNWVWACYANQASNGVSAGSFNICGMVGSSSQPWINNVRSQNRTDTSADVVGYLLTNGASTATIYLFWSTNDGKTDASAWMAGGFVTNFGSYADGTIFTNTIAGLASNTTYYWNYAASNSAGIFWGAIVATPSFKTLGAPLVSNGVGATPVHATHALLNGTLVHGTTARVYTYWWTNGAPVTNMYDYGTIGDGAFSNNAASLVSSTVYYYRIYATNAYGVSWTPVTNFTTASDTVPTAVPGCAFWIEANAGVYTNASGVVTQWLDQSGAGIVVTNTSASSSEPTVVGNWQNGYPAMLWSWAYSSVYGLRSSVGSLAITTGQSRTIFLVAGISPSRGDFNGVFSVDGNHRIELAGRSWPPAGSMFFYNYNPAPDTRYTVNAQLQDYARYVIAIVAQTGSPTNVSVYRNGTLVGSTDNFDCVFYPLTNGVRIGWTSTGGRGYIGHLAEVLVYSNALSPGDHNAIGLHLAEKYDITAYSHEGLAKPTVESLPASIVRRSTSAVLGGVVGNVAADLRFLWSTNGALGETVSGWDGTVLIPNSGVGVAAAVTASSLLPSTVYYWRCMASNVNGTVWSPTASFTTHGSLIPCVPPAVTGGLVLNLDAATLPYTNNESMDWWPDVSGSAVEFTAPASNSQPKLIASVAALANKPAVRFTMGQPLGGAAIPAVGIGMNRTVFIVAIPKTGTGSDWFGWNTSARIGWDAAKRLSVRDSSSLVYSATNSLLLDLPHIIAVTDEGGADPATRIYIDGVERTPYAYASAVSSDRLFDWSMAVNMAVGGGNYAGREYAGDVAQVLLYNRVLSRSEQQTVGWFLQTKYGLVGAYRLAGTIVLLR